MNLLHKLFSFEGRIDRGTYWMLIVPVFLAVNTLAVAPLWIVELMGGMESKELPSSFVVALVLAQAIWLVGLWPMLALGSKRLHDRNKRGLWLLAWWLLPFLLFFGGFGFGFTSRTGDLTSASIVMLAGLVPALWGILEMGILPGTKGPNLYGADPEQPLA